MGAGICAMHYRGMAAVRLAPGVIWDARLVALSVVIAVLASAAAMLIFQRLRRMTLGRARWWHVAAALVMATAITGMRYTGMAAAKIPADALCLSADQLRGDSLGMLVAAAAAVVLLTLTLLASAVQDARQFASSAELVRSLQSANAALQRAAFRDALTGLPNRLLFDERVATAKQRCQREGGALAVLFIDLDGFKPINDSFGHPAGDAVLKEMAQRLSQRIRAGDTVARVGGDEFFVRLVGQVNADAARSAASRSWRVGSTPAAAWCHRRNSSPWPSASA